MKGRVSTVGEASFSVYVILTYRDSTRLVDAAACNRSNGASRTGEHVDNNIYVLALQRK